MKRSPAGAGSETPLSEDAALVKAERREVNRWWRRWTAEWLGAVAGRVGLPQAVHDGSVMALAHMARRLDSQSTPAHVKDRIALALGPKVFIHAHTGAAAPVDQTAQDLLDAYGPDSPRHKLDS